MNKYGPKNPPRCKRPDETTEEYRVAMGWDKPPESPRGTDAQILKERELTIEAINGAMAFGEMGTNPPPDPKHWLAPFWNIGRKLARPCCPSCGTHEVSRQQTCHNSACEDYARDVTIYEGWRDVQKSGLFAVEPGGNHGLPRKLGEDGSGVQGTPETKENDDGN